MDWNVDLNKISDAQLQAALAVANIPALMATMTHLTNDCSHLRGDIQPLVIPLAEEEDGLTEAARQTARLLAFDILRAYRDRGCPELVAPSDAIIEQAMHYTTGHTIPDEQLPLMREELNLFGEDRRRVHIPATSVPDGYRVLIIGAGMSGILAAIRLQEAGIDYLIVDKNPAFGGTWYENTYPGCQVDSANHLYNYLFAPNPEWPAHFSSQASLLQYFQNVVRTFGLSAQARLATRVDSLAYDEHCHGWKATLVGNDGLAHEEQFNSVISAVGQLNTPAMPDIPGIDSFQGTSFHSARWEHQHDLTGKHVAVIGTGCSATQFIPEIAESTGELLVFQRTPNWLLPMENYHEPMEPGLLWCLRNIPFYDRWYRFFLFRARAMDGPLPFLYSEPGWAGEPQSVGSANAMLREGMEAYIREQAGDDTALADALVPDYPPGGKRPILDDGTWISTLKRDDVTLVTEGIEAVTPEGIRTNDGTVHACDVIIYGTGFNAHDFLSTLDVKGKEGCDLHQRWNGDARAYKSVTIPEFPNLYLLYGPNSNIVVGASIVFFSECEMRYIMGCLKMQFEQGLASLEVRPERFQQYNQWVDELNLQRAWGSQSVSSWYKNATGRVSQNWPGTHFQWWEQTRGPSADEFVVTKA